MFMFMGKWLRAKMVLMQVFILEASLTLVIYLSDTNLVYQAKAMRGISFKELHNSTMSSNLLRYQLQNLSSLVDLWKEALRMILLWAAQTRSRDSPGFWSWIFVKENFVEGFSCSKFHSAAAFPQVLVERRPLCVNVWVKWGKTDSNAFLNCCRCKIPLLETLWAPEKGFKFGPGVRRMAGC